MPSRKSARAFPLNLDVADKLYQMADLLEQQHSNPYRVSAYRKAGALIAGMHRDVGALLDSEGQDGLQQLPGIGKGISAAINEIISTGRFSQYERLIGNLDPLRLLQTVPGIGRLLAQAIHEDLHIDTLEELEAAAHDGRLDAVSGMGERRLASVRANLSTMLRSVHRPSSTTALPGVGRIIEIDRQYRTEAAEGKLPLIKPKRFNPEKKAWLPVLHLTGSHWQFTALFSNTARAHELCKTHEWVVVYFYDDEHFEGQCTVVTERHGRLRGLRVVRGREGECDGWYRLQNHRELVDQKIDLVAHP